MGEIFERILPAVPLSWTGERLTTGAGSQVEIEHLHRYLVARALCRNLDVLDIACGEGYGAALIAQTAKNVTAVDIDAASVCHANFSYGRSNLQFLEGDARRIPVPDCHVDAVISFETIEHIYEHDSFLEEVRRVLRPGGFLILSTPERDIYSPANASPNPFHVRELTRAELESMLTARFQFTSIYGQRPMVGSVLLSSPRPQSSAENTPIVTFERRDSSFFEASDGLARPVYLLAIASDSPIKNGFDSVFIDRAGSEEGAAQTVAALRGEIEQGVNALSEATRYARHLESEIAAKNEELAKTHELQITIERQERAIISIEQKLSAVEEAKISAQSQLDELRLLKLGLEEEIALKIGQIEEQSFKNTELVSQARDLGKQIEDASGRENVLKRGIVARDRALAAATKENGRFRSELSALATKMDELSSYIAEQEARIEIATKKLESQSHDALQLKCSLARAEFDREKAVLDLATCQTSTSWRLTRPLRDIFDGHPRLRQTARRTIKALWWTITLQLYRRVEERRRRLAEVAANGAGHIAVSSASNEQHEGFLSSFLAKIQKPDVESNSKSGVSAALTNELNDFLNSNGRISLPAVENPDVSIIVILFNQAHFTLGCIRAIQSQIGPSLEVILVDNGSVDSTASLLSRLDGVKIIKNPDNEGFLLACNRGAKVARGRTLLLLNSDAFPRSGALRAALETLDSASDIGAVGAKLVLPSGSLQEAGSIVWSDASTQGYGRGLAENAWQAMFRRDVDYCSGAFLLTPRAIWAHLGGFDERYAPAYYEEADYCLRLRAAGYRTVYEPTAVVDHYEFGSEEKRGDGFAQTLANRKKLRTKHSHLLRLEHLMPCEANILTARERLRLRKGRLLVLDNEVPITSLGAGYPRARKLLCEAVQEGWAVTFYPLHQLSIDWEAARRELPLEIEIVEEFAVPRLQEFLESRRGFYDVLLVSRPDNMEILNAIILKAPDLLSGTRLIYDAEALFSARDIAKAALEGKPLEPSEAEQRVHAEISLADAADTIICVTNREVEIFRRNQNKRVCLVSHPTNIVDCKAGFADRKGFLFVGRLMENTSPNWEGLSWFIRNCWPLILASLPDATLTVVGRLHADTSELQGPGIRLLGLVDDLASVYASARVFVAPTRFAAGVPIKILEATAAGLPTVASRLMARQLDWVPGVDILAEDDFGAYATAAVDLHEDAEIWTRLVHGAQDRLGSEYSAETFRNQVQSALSCIDDTTRNFNTIEEGRKSARVCAM